MSIFALEKWHNIVYQYDIKLVSTYMKRLLISVLLTLTALMSFAQKRSVDFNDVIGPIKDVNSVGQPPLLGNTGTGMFHYLTEAGVKYSRLHDVGGPFGRNIYVDIPNIFRNFDADEKDPTSYDFTFTDILLKGLTDAGVEPYFRLGVTIENGAATKSYRLDPPKNPAKWARICEHIILHYNYGWADGFNMGISHWEIWNEPENFESPAENQMWHGTFEEYMDLYGIAAPYLKNRFPQLKIGGYGSCGFYSITGNGVKAANSSPRFDYFVDCFIKFLKKASKNHWPLDFFSCHSYATVPETAVHMDYARKMLDKYGFAGTEISVNEWLPSPSTNKLGTALQAAEIAAMIIAFQNGPVNDAEIYDARATGGTYAPLFTPETHKPRKAYFSLKMFGMMKMLGYSVALPDFPEGVYGCAATDKTGNAAIMIANISGQDWTNTFDFPGYTLEEEYILDENYDMALIKNGCADRTVKNNSVALWKFKKGEKICNERPGCDLLPDYTVLLYPDGPVESNGIQGSEAIMDIYLPKENKTSLMTITCPGGGYNMLSVYNEGLYQAKWMVERGMACCVLKYRLPNRHYSIPLTDVQNAMRYLRHHAAEWGITKIGVTGFSAGGHLASCAATLYADEASRPDFAVLLYPRMTLRPDEECSTRDFLVGTPEDWKDNPEEYKRILDYYSPDNHVCENTPPFFIALSCDDDGVPADHFTALYSKLLENKIPVEIHVYPAGGHGFGFGDESLVGIGNDRFAKYRKEFNASLYRWLQEITE